MQAGQGHRWFAAAYDLLDSLDKKRVELMRRSVAGAASGKVLELGAGTGSNLPFYNCDRLESLDATEPDPYMLQRAQTKLEALPSEARARVRLHQLPAESLP